MNQSDLIQSIINCPSRRKRRNSLEALSKSKDHCDQDEIFTMIKVLQDNDRESLATPPVVDLLQRCDPELANPILVSILQSKTAVNLLSAIKSPLRISIDEALSIVKNVSGQMTNQYIPSFSHFIEIILLQDDCWYILPNLIDIFSKLQKKINSELFYGLLKLFTDFYNDPVFGQNIPKFCTMLVKLLLDEVDTSDFGTLDYEVDDNDYRLYINLLHRSMDFSSLTIVNKMLNIIMEDNDRHSIVISTLETLPVDKITPNVVKSINHVISDFETENTELCNRLKILIDV